MIQKTNNERLIYINQALSSGKLNPDVFTMVEDFTNKYGFKKSEFINVIVDPGTKSGKSLFSKLDRKANLENDANFTLLDVADIVRCSIIVESYEQVVPLIKELQKRIPGLKGDISENSTGYKGVHLVFFVNGFKAEMQIATGNVWFAKQAGEEVYSRWRDYNQTEKIEQIKTTKDPKERDLLVDNLFKDLEQMAKENKDCQEMFKKIYEISDFERWKEEINATLVMNNSTKNKPLSRNILNKFNVKINDAISDDELLHLCDEFSNLAKKAQEKLILIATKALIISKNIICKNPKDLLSNEEKAFLLFKKEYMKLLIELSNQKYGEQFDPQEFISTINKISNERSLASVEYCKKRNFNQISTRILRKLQTLDSRTLESIRIAGIEELDKKINASIIRKKQIKEMFKKRKV